jgi:hypothetical protein
LCPSGILHIVAFVTLCEAYMGIEPHFDLWNYFFRAWLWPASDTEAAGCMVPQLFATRGNQLYTVFWAITGGPRYPGYITPIG